MTDEDDTSAEDWQSDGPSRRRRRWLTPLLIFAVALAAGIAVSALWMSTHKQTLAPMASDTAVQLDPSHRPLPAPLAGGSTDLPVAPSMAADASAAPPTAMDAPAEVEPTSTAADSAAPDAATSTAEGAAPSASFASDGASSSLDSLPRLIERTQPDYPADALRDQVQGSARVQVAIDAQGGVTDVHVVESSGSLSLDRAALDAARGWKYKPGMRDGQPFAGNLEVRVDFTLGDQR